MDQGNDKNLIKMGVIDAEAEVHYLLQEKKSMVNFFCLPEIFYSVFLELNGTMKF